MIAEDTRNPTVAWRLDAIRSWLVANNIEEPEPVGWRVAKADLVWPARQHKIEAKYQFDELLSQFGHEVVRIPPYHSEKTPSSWPGDK